MAPMADAVAAMGIPVLNASWLADPKRLGESVADAVCAVAYAYQNASSWGADPDRIIVMGHSGGGQVGMLAGLAPEAFPECERASEAHVWAYIGLAGDPASAAPGGNLRRFLVGSPELLKRMDSYNYIGGNPGLIVKFVHGTSDATVPIELTGAFHDALISAGYDSELIPINGAGHADPANPTRNAGLAALDQLAILASQMPVDASPIEWGWFPGSSPDPVHSLAFRAGDYCYGSSDPPPPSDREVAFLGGALTLSVGKYVSPTVSFEDDDGTTDLGNPFGEDAWLCTVASDGESVLAVGSDVWWSNDGITWHIVEAFRDIGGPHLNGSNLVWAGAGPLGYVVLGQSWGDGWYSPDLTKWYEIAIEDGPDVTERGWFGPGNVTISDKMIVIGAEHGGAWIGTPSN